MLHCLMQADVLTSAWTQFGATGLLGFLLYLAIRDTIPKIVESNNKEHQEYRRMLAEQIDRIFDKIDEKEARILDALGRCQSDVVMHPKSRQKAGEHP